MPATREKERPPGIIASGPDFQGVDISLADTTLEKITTRLNCRYASKITVEHLYAVVGDPDRVQTNPPQQEHPERHNYYRASELTDGKYTRVIVEHSTTPSRFVTAWVTKKFDKSGTVLYERPQGGEKQIKAEDYSWSYDQAADVMYIDFETVPDSDIEDTPRGFHVRYSEPDHRVVGLVILDYARYRDQATIEIDTEPPFLLDLPRDVAYQRDAVA